MSTRVAPVCHTTSRCSLAVLLTTWLVACSGGGGDSGPHTGRFLDGPVQGLRYSTPTLSGVTNAAGEFSYRSGETVGFYVGDILVGSAPGAATISPFELAGMAVPNTALDIRGAVILMNQEGRRRAAPLEVAANIAVFLQTLDADGSPGGAILIPDEIHAIATGMTLRFDQRMWSFGQDHSFRKLMAQGRSVGLWGGTRAIRSASYALDALSEGLGPTPTIQALIRVERDDDEDPVTPNTVTRYTYDANGKVRTEEEDPDNDASTPNEVITNTYDADGRVTRQEIESNGDPTTPEAISTYTYDANGNQTLSESDTNGDGQVDFSWAVIYDDEANPIGYEADDGDQNTPLSVYTNTFDANGRMIEQEFDANNDGQPESVGSFIYDENGNRIREEWDVTGDRVTDTVYEFTYDADGNRTSEVHDADNDPNTPNERTTYAYDADGREILNEYDSDGDGNADTITMHTYDSQGNRASRVFDGDGDPSTTNTVTTYTYDANGNVTRVEIDFDGNLANPERIVTYQYDADGYLLTEVYDADNDPNTANQLTTYRYEISSRWAPLFDGPVAGVN